MAESAVINSDVNEEVSVEIAEKRVFTKTEKIYAFVVMLLAFLWMQFQIFNPAGFITSAVNIAIITVSVVFLKKQGCGFSPVNRVITAVLYAFSLVFSITDNGFIKFLVGVFLFAAGAYLVYSVGEGKREIEKYLPIALVKAVFEFPFSDFGAEPAAVKSTIGESKSAGNIKYIFLGLLFTLPVTLLVANLLISADAGMESFMNSIFTNALSKNGFELILRFIISLPCGFYLYGMLSANSKRENLNVLDAQLCQFRIESAKSIPNMAVYAAITPILLLYVIFFFSQASYFLSAFSGNLPEGYSYSQYARRGFFELCGVTVINLLIIIFISFLTQKSGRNKPKSLKFYTLSLSFSTIILIAVAISKMIMYISEYGLTRLRFYTMWFMILCAFMFVLIIVKQFRFEMKFSAWFSGIFTVMLALLCFCSPDFVIAKYNIDMYKAGYLDDLDTALILDMSDDAILYGVMQGELNVKKAYYVSAYSDNEIVDYLNVPSLILREELGEIEFTPEEKEDFSNLRDLF